MPPSATKARPRKAVASLDAEAAERRRTQLRVAQRAFRKRRDATTEELREQVNELQNVHDGLLSSIRDLLKDSSVKGSDNALALALESLLERYITRPSEENSEDGKDAASTSQQHVAKAQRSLSTAASATGASSAASPTGDLIALSQGDTSNALEAIYRSDSFHFAHSLPVDLFWSASSDLPDLLQPLQPFGYDEAPFSIRLRRRGIQAGYQ